MMTSRAGDDGDAPLELRGGRGADGGGQGVIIFHQKTPARIRDAFTRSCSSSVCVFIFPFDLWVKKKKKKLVSSYTYTSADVYRCEPWPSVDVTKFGPPIVGINGNDPTAMARMLENMGKP